MKILFFFLILISIIPLAKAQKLSGEFKYKVTYELTFRPDSTDLNSQSEHMILFLGDELSVYSSRAKTQNHSPKINGFKGQTSSNALTAFHDVIIKQEGKIYNTKQIPKIPGDHFYYVEENNGLDWKMSSETKIIKGYKTQKATTSFAGRDYIAWFTPEIPIPDGPYKFYGLPGLLLEIADTKNDYIFNFIGLEKLSPTIPFKLNLKHLIKTSKKELNDLWYRYRKDPFTYANNPNVKISPEVHKKYIEAFTEILDKENNPIELY